MPDDDPGTFDALTDAIRASVAAGDEFAGVLSSALMTVALELGSVYALTARRPGSWESDHVRHLAAGAAAELGEGWE